MAGARHGGASSLPGSLVCLLVECDRRALAFRSAARWRAAAARSAALRSAAAFAIRTAMRRSTDARSLINSE